MQLRVGEMHDALGIALTGGAFELECGFPRDDYPDALGAEEHGNRRVGHLEGLRLDAHMREALGGVGGEAVADGIEAGFVADVAGAVDDGRADDAEVQD